MSSRKLRRFESPWYLEVKNAVTTQALQEEVDGDDLIGSPLCPESGLNQFPSRVLRADVVLG